MFKAVTVIGLIALLFGCAGADRPFANVSCHGENWKELGMQTAKALSSIRTFDTYIETCGSSLDPTAKAAFIDGYARALIDICTKENGRKLGAANQELPNVCPLELRADFQQGYVQGKRDYYEKVRELKKISDDQEKRSVQHGQYGVGDPSKAQK